MGINTNFCCAFNIFWDIILMKNAANICSSIYF